MYALTGQSIEVAIETATRATVTVKGSTTIKASAGAKVGRVTFEHGLISKFNPHLPKSVTLSGTTSGLSIATFGNTRVIVADKKTASTFWAPRLSATGNAIYDASPGAPSVLVQGPYLVRSAAAKGSVLDLTGDLNATTTIDVFGPTQFTSVTWNGAPVSVTKSDLGSLRGTVAFPASLPAVKIPALDQVEWSCADSLPELAAGFDDSSWVLANKTTTSRPQKPTAGKVSVTSVSADLRR